MMMRLLVMAGLLTVPFAVLAFAYGKAEGLVWLMIPFIAMLPVLFLISLVLVPAEAFAIRHDLSPNVAVIATGAAIGCVICGLAVTLGRNRTEVIGKLLGGDLATLGAVIGIVVVGGLIGAAWRLSGHILS